MFAFIITLIFFHFSTILPQHIVEVRYWPLPPYIFDENNKTTGMLVKFIEKMSTYCENAYNFKMVPQFKKVAETRKDFLKQTNNISDSSSDELFIWGPYISNQTTGELNKQYKGQKYTAVEFFKGTNIIVVVNKKQIYILNKILDAFNENYTVVTILLVISAYTGILIWLIEHRENSEFNSSFYRGAGTGLWWSFVTLMTVGYGDVIPKKLFGRVLAVIYIIFGVLNCNLMTALITDSIFGESGISILNKNVSVFKDSAEKRLALLDFNATVTEAESYEEVVQNVRKGNVFAALMKENVAAWMKPSILMKSKTNNVELAVVSRFKREFSINFIVTQSDILKEYTSCYKAFEKEQYTVPENMFKKLLQIETVYFPSWDESFYNVNFQMLLGVVCCIVIASILFELRTRKIKKKKIYITA
ncbi:potassium voltage-gated channel subfamily A member 10 isoform X1 [Hydra vulgaris]|uniref:potassium voltage-gated channel subfamily A member 10 isoform X1 n=1 Tax=Hydra vulgaris TaxID=6087 RepID=UPI001F5E6ADA|nr:potassium voltage-gated channel subfamily A member 10-like [Hydra vulgaris]